jgi:dynein assembly factor 3
MLISDRVITDSKGPLSKLIDFGALKFRERDDLEFGFKFWRGNDLLT